MIKVLAQKIIITIPILGIAFFFVVQADFASAHFSDSIRASDKAIKAGYLDSTLGDNGWESEINIAPGEINNREIVLTNIGSLDFQYLFELEIKAGSDASFCDALQLQAIAGSETKYQGSVSDFNLVASEILAVGNSEDWNFLLSLPASSSDFSDAECRIEIIFDSWQVNLGKNQQGFSLTESLGENVIIGEDNSENTNSNSTDQSEVVINEILWAGSGASGYDQWIELRNLSDQTVDIGGWVIENAKSGGDNYTIPDGSSIAANDFFLITHYPATSTDSALAVSENKIESSLNFNNEYGDNGQVVLKNNSGEIVDKTPEPTGNDWPAGENETGGDEKKWSMQRGENPGDGSDSGNWHTCDRDVLEKDGTLDEMEDYWKDNYQSIMCGTPGHMNFSSNDLTKKAEAEISTSDESFDENKKEVNKEKQEQPQEEASGGKEEEVKIEVKKDSKEENDPEDADSDKD